MKHLKIRLILSILVILTLPAFVTAGDQEFSVSKKTPGFQMDVRAAVNTKSGDVIVTWLQFDKDSYFPHRLYAACCKLSKNGKFQAKNARLISNPKWNTDFHNIAYNPEDNSFMAIWSGWNMEGQTNHVILARKLNSKGKAVGPIVKVVDGPEVYRYPVIHYAPSTTIPAAVNKGGFIIVYTQRESLPAAKDKTGLYSAFLDHRGNLITSKVTRVSKPIASDGMYSNYITAHGIIRTQDGSYFCNLEKSDSDINYLHHVLKLNAIGDPVKEIMLYNQDSSGSGLIALSGKKLLATWEILSENRLVWINQLLNTKLRKIKKEFQALEGYEPTENEFVKLNGDPGAYQISYTYLAFIGRYVTAKGKLVGDERLITWTSLPLHSFKALCLPNSNRIFLVRAEGHSGQEAGPGKDMTINAYVFDAIEK